jgi:C-terminal processing protease CtpA/Prc
MKKLGAVLAVLALVSTAGMAIAGGGAKCTSDVSACLTHWSEYKTAGYLGMKYDKAEDGTVTVKDVAAGTPAAAAGFQKGDVILTLNGAAMKDKDAVKKAKGAWKPGDKVSYTVLRGKSEKTLAVTLGTMPEDVYAQMVGEHMISNHMTVATADAAH